MISIAQLGHGTGHAGAAALDAVRGARGVAASAARRAVPALLAVTAVGALLLVVNPAAVASAVTRFDGRVLLPILLLIAAFYALQGLRWHLLLRAVGARQSAADSELINLAGATVTSVLPLGDLTRALLASEASGVDFGATAATVTVQELTFSLLLVIAAGPGLVHLPHGFALALAVTAGVVAVLAILTVQRIFTVVRRGVAHIPGVRRFLGEIDSLQRSVRSLLARPAVLAGTVLDLGRVVAATAALLLILSGLHVGGVTWWQAELVLAVSYVGGALSLLPGGIGANEASVVGILVVLGVNPADAAAAAILQRVTLTGFGTVGGFVAYLAVRQRLGLSGLSGLRRLGATALGRVPAAPAA